MKPALSACTRELDANVASICTGPAVEEAGNRRHWKPAAVVGSSSRAANVIVGAFMGQVLVLGADE